MKKSISKSTKKSAINRSIKKENILRVIEEAKRPVSTAEVAEALKHSWHTVIRYCLELENEGKLVKFEIGRINVWHLKGNDD